MGVTMERVDGFRTGVVSRNSGVFAALDRRVELVGTVRPALSRPDVLLTALRSFHPDREAWWPRAYLSPRAFRRRTAVLTRELADWRGRYDVIFELQSLFAVRAPDEQRPYVIYTDSIFPLTRRMYPAWAPLSERAARRVVELEGATCRAASTVFAYSHFLRNALIEDYGCDPDRVVVVGAGCNSLADDLEDRTYGSQVALFLGIDFERKGGNVLLDAWKRVRAHLPQAELWIAGPERRQAAQLDGVRWLGYVNGRADVAELLRRADLFAMPSIFEPYGLVFLEAMGHGVPCLATDACAMPEIIREGETGRLVPVGEPEPLADAMIEMLGDPARLELMGRRAYAETRASATWDDVADRMLPRLLAAAALERGMPGRVGG